MSSSSAARASIAVSTARTSRRRIVWRGPAAMAVMALGMLDTMVPRLQLVPAMAWVALELGLAIAVAVPGRRARCCTPLAAHRALGLIVMAALTVAMVGMGATTDASAADPMPRMQSHLVLTPVALAAAALYTGWSLWRARAHASRFEMLLSAASVALMAVFAAH